MNVSEIEAYKAALKAIETCKRNAQTELTLSGKLKEVPPEIAQLTALTTLNLSQNALTILPKEIGRLDKLELLILNNNELTELPIEIGQLSNLKVLSLASNQLTILPSEIGRLAKLELLNVSTNQLTRLPKEIGRLVHLDHLDVGNNRLVTLSEELRHLRFLKNLEIYKIGIDVLPDWIGEFSALEELVINANPLTELPSTLQNLHELKHLYLGRGLGGCPMGKLPEVISSLKQLTVLHANQCELTSLPVWMGDLPNLTELDFHRNEIALIPSSVGRLTNLRRFNLSINRLSTLPKEIGLLQNLEELALIKNQLVALPDTLGNLNKLERFYLHDNVGLNLSPSVLGPDPRKTDEPVSPVKSILDLYFGRTSGLTRPLNEVKLILVGRGGAGKTSTVNALRGLPFQDGQDSTPGIALCDWKIDCIEGQPVTAHVWDFAGQVITHALHQFFFSMRSIYVVVLTGRENNERDDAEYWLRLIKAFGTDDNGEGPPVIIGLNKWDVPGCRPKVDRSVLRERYPFIRGFVEMDCKSAKGIAKLRTAIARQVNLLSWVREPFPGTWDTVRRALASGRTKRAHLTYEEYRTLCVQHGVTDYQQQDSLSEILHNLGIALNYRKDARLREATVLQPEWLTKNVYALMRRAEKQAGVLRNADLEIVLKAEKDKSMRTYLVRIMERFEIAYTPRSTASGVWLIPQALPDTQPKGIQIFRESSEATRLRYTYQALPEGLVARAIVRLHEFVEETEKKRQQWASGAVLVREGAHALIRTDPQDRQVTITVIGPLKPRQQLAGLCQSEMRDIHKEIPGLDPLEETQVQGEWMATATLEIDERKGRKTGLSTKDRGTIDIDPTEPNNAYSEKLARVDEIWKPKAFISYSKNNIAQRKRLESELKILKNEGLLERGWHDRMIDPGDKWDPAIQKQLSEADVIIVLISSAALSTDYITTHEIPKAIALHEAGKTIVIPVILESCRWDKTLLGSINALPDKAKPINSWSRTADAWKSVADGLATVFEKLIAGNTTKRSVAATTRDGVNS